MTTLSTPSLVDSSMMAFMAGIIISTPSRPNRFSDWNFFLRNPSKPAAREIRASSIRFSSAVSSRAPGVSKRSRIQFT